MMKITQKDATYAWGIIADLKSEKKLSDKRRKVMALFFSENGFYTEEVRKVLRDYAQC